MIEQGPIADLEPLPTKPPSWGAEAELQNPDYPNLTPEDSLFIAKTISKNIGEYPVGAPWTEPINEWSKALRARIQPISQANSQIHEHFAETKGSSSALAVSTGILAEITPELTQIAAAQFEEGFHGPKSWNETNPEACVSLMEKINKILEDDKNLSFFVQNSSFRQGLELMQTVLITSGNPNEIFVKNSEYMKMCTEANARGEIVLYIPFESDFTNPVKNEKEKTEVCEAMVSVLIPLDKFARVRFDKLENATWELLRQQEFAHQHNTKLNILVGTNIMGAGFEALSSTVGEAFVLKHKGTHEHGFYLAINNLAKKKDFWLASSELVNIEGASDLDSFYKYFTFLYLLHEQGHKFFPEHGITGEVPADIPAVMYALQISVKPELIGDNPESREFKPQETVKAILTEYVSEIVNSVSNEAWIEGHKANTGNDLFDGYILSAVIIVNSLVKNGIIRVNRERKIDVNLTVENLNSLLIDLKTINRDFHNKKPETLVEIRLAVASPEARELIDLYRLKIKEKSFTGSPLPIAEYIAR